MNKRLLSIRAAAARIGMPYSMPHKLVHSELCPFPVFCPAPSLYYIAPADIDRWKTACTTSPLVGRKLMSAKAKTISVAGTLCLGVKKATAEIERVSGKPCSVDAAYKALEKGRRINGVSIREVAEPACPSRTGIPLGTGVPRLDTPSPSLGDG